MEDCLPIEVVRLEGIVTLLIRRDVPSLEEIPGDCYIRWCCQTEPEAAARNEKSEQQSHKEGELHGAFGGVEVNWREC